MLFFTQKGGNVTGKLETGQSYVLQKKDASGQWVDMEWQVEPAWEDIAYDLKLNTTTELSVNWESLYGTLEPGEYKIIKNVMDYRKPGDFDGYIISAEFELKENEDMESVSDFLSVELPQGYWISNFYDNLGWQGGAIILPRAYEAEVSDTAMTEWLYSGLVSRINAKESTGVTFVNGVPKMSGLPVQNHTVSEYVEVINGDESKGRWPAILLESNHDLYTAAEIEELKKEGEDTEHMELTSTYWDFWFVKEGKETYYLLSLSAKKFTKKEAVRIAKTVAIYE